MIQGSQTTFICGACINESSSIVVLTKLEEIQIRQSSIVRQGIGYLQTTCPLEKRQITLFGQKWREIFFQILWPSHNIELTYTCFIEVLSPLCAFCYLHACVFYAPLKSILFNVALHSAPDPTQNYFVGFNFY